MNINPKKSWHVRSKTNIAKVTRDEAKFEAEGREKKRRVKLAQSDERWTQLKRTAKERGFGGQADEGTEAIDLFKDVKRGIDGAVTESKEHQSEKKQDQEKWEKKIGLLKFLGEGSAEFSAEKPWWTKNREKSSDVQSSERDKHSKMLQDPLADVNRSIKKVNENSQRKVAAVTPIESTGGISSSSKSIDQLRRERLERERKERERSQTLLADRGIIPKPKELFPSATLDDERKRPYNSAFNASISSHLRR